MWKFDKGVGLFEAIQARPMTLCKTKRPWTIIPDRRVTDQQYKYNKKKNSTSGYVECPVDISWSFSK